MIAALATMTLAHLLALNRIAKGTAAPDAPRTRIERWAYVEGGETGTQTLVMDGDDFREDTVLGPFHRAQGELAGRFWDQNANGLIRFETGVHERDRMNAYALAHALAPGSGVKFIGEVSAPIHAFEVAIAPAHGRIERAYYDPATYLLVRDERESEGRTFVRTYDDFRTTAGVREAWHVHESNGLPKDDRDWRMQSLSIGGRVRSTQVAIPASQSPVVLTGPRVTLPATIDGDRIVVTAQLGAHKINLLLDSGASGILLNRAVADAAGVQSLGETTQVTAGQYSASDALVPKLDLGVAAMQHFAAETAPYADRSYGDVPIAGLLGYDFIAGTVLHIDYYRGVVEAVSPAAFSPPAGAIALPLRLDDGVPIISVKIGASQGETFVVDTGADRSMIFSSFAISHPSEVKDQGLGEEMTSSLPFISDINGVGGTVQVRPVQVSALQIGTIRLPAWLFEVSQDAPSFEGDDYDGLIGQDVLRNFDVYFDYGRAMLYLLPNDRYRQRWGSSLPYQISSMSPAPRAALWWWREPPRSLRAPLERAQAPG